MSFWDKIKDKIPKLADIRLIGGDLYIGGNHYKVDNPASLKIENVSVTPEKEKEYYKKLEQRISMLESELASMPDNKMFEALASTSATVAIAVSSGSGNITLPLIQIKGSGSSTSDIDSGENLSK